MQVIRYIIFFLIIIIIYNLGVSSYKETLEDQKNHSSGNDKDTNTIYVVVLLTFIVILCLIAKRYF